MIDRRQLLQRMVAASAAGASAPLLIQSVVRPAAAASAGPVTTEPTATTAAPPSCAQPFAAYATSFVTTPALSPAGVVTTKPAGTVLDGWTVVGTNVDAIGRNHSTVAAFVPATTAGTVIIELSGSHLNPTDPSLLNSGIQRSFSLPCGSYSFGYLWQQATSIAGTIIVAGTSGTLATQPLAGPTSPANTALTASFGFTVPADDTVTITIRAGDHANQGIRITNLSLQKLP